ncbi:MAG: GNAT family N-acetyltransferase [Acidimicrobiales bacterium]
MRTEDSSGDARGSGVVLRDLTGDEIAAVRAWRYDGPWSVYDSRGDEDFTAENGYRAIEERRTGHLLGYVCTGVEARVQGMTELPGVLDVGVGLDPALVGKGRGRSVLLPVLELLAHAVRPEGFRAVVQSWNTRSIRLCDQLGFEKVGAHVAVQTGMPVEYVVLRRPAH